MPGIEIKPRLTNSSASADAPVPAPTPAPPKQILRELPTTRFRVQIAPRSEALPGGEIAEGTYEVSGNDLVVRDLDGAVVGRCGLLGGDPLQVAKQILRGAHKRGRIAVGLLASYEGSRT
jgi:hypothetical protein